MQYWTQISRKVLKNLALLFIFVYRSVFRGFLGGVCRFQPTCSHYAEQAFREYPPVKALKLSVIRLSKCHPWGPFGFDPLPPPVNAHE